MADTASVKVSEKDCAHLKKLIREVPDFPKQGILFYDITTLLKDKVGFAILIDALSEHYLGKNIDLVLGMEARGFIFGPAVARRHGRSHGKVGRIPRGRYRRLRICG